MIIWQRDAWLQWLRGETTSVGKVTSCILHRRSGFYEKKPLPIGWLFDRLIDWSWSQSILGGNFKVLCAHLSFQLRKHNNANKTSSTDSSSVQSLIKQHLETIEENSTTENANNDSNNILPTLWAICKENRLQFFNSPSANSNNEDVDNSYYYNSTRGKLLVLHFFTYCCANCLW